MTYMPVFNYPKADGDSAVHYRQAIVTGFVLALEVDAQEYRAEQKCARAACLYDSAVALAAWRQLLDYSLIADWIPTYPAPRLRE